jgi:glycosyltransferase involved in cell wall biosynthesis
MIAVAGARLAHRPVILKVVGDPAWERGARRGLTDKGFDQFQESTTGSPALRLMRLARNWSTRQANLVVTPSPHLVPVVNRWGDRSDVVVVPNGVRSARSEGRPNTAASPDLHVIFVGRLVAHKRVDVLIEAVARAGATLLEVVGDGPELDRLEALADRLQVSDRVTFSGALPHATTMQRLEAADALALASSYEGLPHVVLEALVAATPVVTTRANGLGAVLTDGEDAIMVPEPTPEAFGAAFRRLADDPALLGRLRSGALASGGMWSFERCVDGVEALLRGLTKKQPRAIFLGKTRMSIPPSIDDEQKFEIHRRHMATLVVCTGKRPGVARPGGAKVLVLPSPRRAPLGTIGFYAAGPAIALVLALGRRRTAIVCQSPYEGFGVALLRMGLPEQIRPRMQVELHGEWRTATRTYGSPRRRILAPIADRVAVWTLRRADRVRVVSMTLGDLARSAGYGGPLDRFVAFSNYSAFLDEPVVRPPENPRALFVGVLEKHKAVDTLLDAWHQVLKYVPNAKLEIVGTGRLQDKLQCRVQQEGLGDSVQFRAPVPRPELRGLIDSSSCLVLPSRTEGLPRIVLEVMARARPVVATRVGGIPEFVEDGRTGRLVRPSDPLDLADALCEVLSDPARACAMGDESRQYALERNPLREYEAGIQRLAEWIASP